MDLNKAADYLSLDLSTLTLDELKNSYKYKVDYIKTNNAYTHEDKLILIDYVRKAYESLKYKLYRDSYSSYNPIKRYSSWINNLLNFDIDKQDFEGKSYYEYKSKNTKAVYVDKNTYLLKEDESENINGDKKNTSNYYVVRNNNKEPIDEKTYLKYANNKNLLT
jgi:hypothetical protein